MTPSSTLLIRKAAIDDEQEMLSLVDALADYEKLPRPDVDARRRLSRDCFGERPRFEALLAEYAGRCVGYAFFFETYSSFLALPTLYLEDIFILPDHRKMKIGFKLFTSVMKEAYNRGCGRMEWTVLNWNSIAIDFYKSLHAKHMEEWQFFRMVRGDMEKVLDGMKKE